jgi:hormone-sensitive lipase
MFFIPGDHISNLTAYCRALQGMDKILYYAVMLMEASPPNELFNDGEVSETLRMVVCTEYISRDVFYGRCLGFQYPSSIRPIIKMLAIAMASYERWYKADKDNPLRQLLHSLWKGNKYLQNPTQMGLKLDELTRMSSVYFVKAFWSIMEQDAVKAALNLISHSVEISHSLEVPAKNIVMEGSKGQVTLTPPFSEQLGYRPIPLLLVSHKWRSGQNRGFASKKQPLPASSGLIVHIHGGGFVAQSPKSHEFYLRSWSQELQCPVVSIDYSLCPDAPFPRPLEECTMAYAWILQNLALLGTTGEHIVLVGDSAGGNLAMTTAMKILEHGLRRPNRVVIVYPTLNCTVAVSPSRFLSLFDPILPIGVLINCMHAYSNMPPDQEEVQKRRDQRTKILRAKGVYLPDPSTKNTSPPSLPRRQGDKLETDGPDSEGRQSKKTPPPRPAPPTVSLPPSLSSPEHRANVDNGEAAAASISSNGVGVRAGSKLCTVDLGSSNSDDGASTSESGGSETHLTDQELLNVVGEDSGGEAVDQVDFGGKNEPKKRHVLTHQPTTSLLYCCRDPDEGDRLSPAEIERMTRELLKALGSPESNKNPYMSPILAPEHMLIGLPPVHIIATSLDPLLDDSVAMAHRLQSLGQAVTLNVVDNIPHGFLCFKSTGSDQGLEAGQRLCTDYIRQGLGMMTNPR